MFCPKCGTEAPDGAAFCHACGHDLAATTPMAALRSPSPATEIDVVKNALRADYEILGELGRGGMAIVYRAHEVMLDREVAIKVLPFSLAFDKDFVERFQREARTAARLEHPNIIPIYRVGKADQVIYFAMRFLRGKSLAQMVEDGGAIAPKAIRKLLTQCGSALGYAHKHGIVHRDIKPDNIMFKESGEAVLCDFGIAKAASGTRLTGTGMAIGTPYYMSPEQARAQSLDGRSDLYSLGVVAYQCLTGSVPFEGEDSFSIGYKHIMEELPTPTLETVEERALFEVVRKMMAKDPDDRYQTADELVAALADDGPTVTVLPTVSSAPTTPLEAIPAVVVSPPAGVPATSHVAGSPTTPTTPMPRTSIERGIGSRVGRPPKKKRTAILVGAFLLLFVGGIGGGGYYYVAFMDGSIPLLDNVFPSLGGGNPTVEPLTPRDPPGAPLAGTALVSGSTTVDPATPADSGLLDTNLVAGVSDTAAADTAAADPPGEVSEPADPPAPQPGTVVFTGVGGNAQLYIDGRNVRGLTHELDPGEYAIRITRAGFQEYTRSVTVQGGERSVIRVQMVATVSRPPPDERPPPPPSQCAEHGPTYNVNGECFDARPTPKNATIVPLTPEVEGTPQPAILAIEVGVDGRVMDVVPVRPSNDSTFTALALAFAQSLEFNPAQKDGQAVVAWTQVPFHPGQRP